MKVIFEIPDRMLDVMRGLMMMSVDSESDEREMNEAVEQLKAMKEPLSIDLEGKTSLFGKDLSDEKKKIGLAVASFAICKVLADNDECELKSKEG